jgi:biotin operon repressor
MISNRKFGIEVEFVGDKAAAAEALRNAGIRVELEHYNHTTRGHWKIVDDSSIQEDGGELVSPPLSGPEGLASVRTALTALREAGLYASFRCGLHVHVDANDFVAQDILAVSKRYESFQRTIDKVMPASRVGGQRAHIGPVTDQNSHLQRKFTANPNITARVLAGSVNERYVNLNLCAFLRQGTIEFRQHSGTTDPTRAVNWIVFCVKFMDDCKGSMVTETLSDPIANVPAPTPAVSGGTTLGDLIRMRLAHSAPAATPAEVPVAPASQGPSAPLRVRSNSIDNRFVDIYNLFMDNLSLSVSAGRIAQTVGISEASVPSYISMMRDRFPTLQIHTRRGRGYVVYNRPAVTPVVTAPVAPAPATRTIRRYAPNPAAEQNPFSRVPNSVSSYYKEKAYEFGHNDL